MLRKFQVVFVLGGPGSGKGTQSSLIQKHFRFKHLSAGQLLRQEQVRPKSEFAPIIKKVILQGKIVPSEITIQLLKNAMKKNSKKCQNFLIDGFPRNQQNFNSWRKAAKEFSQTPFILHFRCSEEIMLKRLLNRSKVSGRSDDNVEVIKKRFVTYYTQTQHVLNQFEKLGKVYHLNGDLSTQEVFDQVKPLFKDFLKTSQEEE